jgi:hypothetical protein
MQAGCRERADVEVESVILGHLRLQPLYWADPSHGSLSKMESDETGICEYLAVTHRFMSRTPHLSLEQIVPARPTTGDKPRIL